MMLSALFSNILRSEGAAKKSMVIQILTACINVIIDPFFIYKPFGFGLDMGIAGASTGTIVAMFIGLLLAVYWFRSKDATYLTLSFKKFRFDPVIDKQIFTVGIPASLEMMTISVIAIVMNNILLWAGGDDAVAVYSSSWRIITLLMIPLMATGSAMVPVCAAAYGAKRFDRVEEAYRFTMKFVIVIMLILSLLTALTAEYMVMIFTYTSETAHLRTPMTHVMFAACVFLPFASWGATASALFQSLTMGTKSLICTLIRNLMQIPVCIFLFNMGGSLDWIWIGVAIGQIFGSAVAGIWGEAVLRQFTKNAEKYRIKEKPSD